MLELLNFNLIFVAKIVLIIFVKVHVANTCCKGCIDVDELTFEKVMVKYPYTLVKFDISYPYGEKHEEYAKFAKNYAKKIIHDLLIVCVGVKDYGDKDNMDLALKYSVDKNKFPEIVIFKNTTLHARWPGYLDIKYENIKKFIKENTELYIGLDGCLKEFDDIAAKFMKTSNVDEKSLILSNSKSRSDIVKGTSNIYILTMEKILKFGNNFIIDEKVRLEKLSKTKISSSKKKEISQKLNILKIFNSYMPKNDEL
ncbi:protein windbeutel [Condylostylus longicornis]|uniref:protein windbeutel n=1 Tax=Condylostylus longicornis TaxID=2530218 RepID=UPI00244E433B|nr:protein windbeutel [Condylostylus longicornis]